MRTVLAEKSFPRACRSRFLETLFRLFRRTNLAGCVFPSPRRFLLGARQGTRAHCGVPGGVTTTTRRKESMKTTIAAIAAMVMGTAALMAEDDIVVKKQINVLDRVQIAPNTMQVLMEIELPHGVWDTSASATLFCQGQEGKTVFFAGAISQGNPTINFNDGRTVIGSTVILNGRADPTVAMVGRDLDIDPPPGTTTHVYVMLWVYTSNPAELTRVDAYGFIRARKIPGT